ncbi:hypothetical protein [uncultured Porticoccus sp.]|uniref:hypothetical protein n=1 Tax=uncultured Porticoccus sp. TaxID=1256050 RepID=UPI002601775A|nr:hypothetical protein [uncultured Porticoccus sp.]
MKGENRDKRKFSGNRVIGRCEITLKNLDPFSFYEDTRSGYMVLNIRGACLYLNEGVTEKVLEKIFPDGKNTVFKEIRLFSDLDEEMVIKNIKAAFLRIRRGKKRAGIVIRFTDISEEHLDKLSNLINRLPSIEGDEEAALPSENAIKPTS